MAIDKKSAKGRLDKWYKLAKEKGYRARAAFKLIQLNRKYHVLEKAKVLIDLCAAPGSWLQVASEVMPPNSLMVGVDLAPIKPIPRCTVFQSDITSDKCRATLRQHIKTLKADVVLHDGAPNVGTAWIQDAFSQAELVLQSLKLATEFLAPGGTFITKVFRSKDYNSLLWVFNQLFNKVEATKPPSSRSVSAEIFVVCRDFKAPKRIDPRFLDSKHVFAELSGPQVDVEAKVFKPEQKRRKRDGYEEGDWTQHKEVAASEFIQTGDPISMLGSINKLSFEQKPNGDVALAALDRMPETTLEVRQCCQDLKVLGRKEFKILLRWRSKVRDILGFSTKAKAQQEAAAAAEEEEVAEVEDMDEEMKMQEDMQKMIDAADAKKKRAKRKDNERKQKEIVRMQMNMTTPFDVLETDDRNEDSMFALKTAEKSGDLSSIVRGKMAVVSAKPDADARAKFREIAEDDDAADDIEGQLDSLYNQYKERKASTDAKYRAKRARTEHHDDDFEGFSDREDVSSEDEIDNDSDSDSEDDATPASKTPLLTDLSSQPGSNGLSKRASLFFDQDIFKGIDMTQDDSGVDVADDSSSDSAKPVDNVQNPAEPQTSAMTAVEEESSDDDFEIVTEPKPVESWEVDDAEERDLTKDGRPRVDIITAEAMTLAHQMATGQRTRGSLVDDSFNRYSHRDVDGLPEWFLDDEDRHSRLQKPVTRDAAAAIKEKLRALNARPIKKVREAKARKKFKAAQRLEKLKKKSALLVEDGDMTEKDKAEAVRKLMGKALKRKPRQQVSVVVAKGGNRGISGRPKGTKGKYKMVDARLKKDVRGLKRAKARKK